MFSDHTKKGESSQDNMKRSPEDAQKRPSDTMLREEAMIINGRPVIISTEAYVDKDGRTIRQIQKNYQVAADGRWLPVTEFVALSWTGLLVPVDSLADCMNPYDLHGHRRVYVNQDGKVTDKGNILCDECLEHQDNLLKWRRWTLCLYNPEIF